MSYTVSPQVCKFLSAVRTAFPALASESDVIVLKKLRRIRSPHFWAAVDAVFHANSRLTFDMEIWPLCGAETKLTEVQKLAIRDDFESAVAHDG